MLSPTSSRQRLQHEGDHPHDGLQPPVSAVRRAASGECPRPPELRSLLRPADDRRGVPGCGRPDLWDAFKLRQHERQCRAVDLPHEGFGSNFLDTFDRPQRVSVCECERSAAATLGQVLLLANSDEVENKIADGKGRAKKLIDTNRTPLRSSKRSTCRPSRDPRALTSGRVRSRTSNWPRIRIRQCRICCGRS